MENLNQHLPPGLLDKLNKLRNLEEGAKSVGSHEEAANAAAKYQDLLLKYNLDEQAVVSHGIQKKAQMLTAEFDLDLYQSKTESNWLNMLVNSVAHFCMCKTVKTVSAGERHRYDQGVITILGEKHNVATVFYLVEQLMSKIDIACKMSYKVYTGFESRNTFRRGFLIGAVQTIHVRFHEKEKEILEKSKQGAEFGKVAPNTNMGLMIVDKRALATRFMNDKFPNLIKVKARAKSLTGNDGRREGIIAGSKMELNRGVESRGNQGYLE